MKELDDLITPGTTAPFMPFLGVVYKRLGLGDNRVLARRKILHIWPKNSGHGDFYEK
jgi:hypothetical protein